METEQATPAQQPTVVPAELEIRDLHASIDGKEILRGVNLTVRQGETHALMGPNGSGKSTLANVIMGHPRYEVTQGEIRFNGINLLELSRWGRVDFRYIHAGSGVYFIY